MDRSIGRLVTAQEGKQASRIVGWSRRHLEEDRIVAITIARHATATLRYVNLTMMHRLIGRSDRVRGEAS